MPKPTRAQVGTTIRELRQQHSLTLEALAHQAELHTTSISRIEAGRQNVTWDALESIAAVLDVDILELVRLAAGGPSSGAG